MKSCDGLNGTCEEYPACICGKAWREHTSQKGLKMKLRDGEKEYLDGYLSAFEDLPDGAWQAACEEAIGREPKFRGRDPYDVWMAWAKANSSTVVKS